MLFQDMSLEEQEDYYKDMEETKMSCKSYDCEDYKAYAKWLGGVAGSEKPPYCCFCKRASKDYYRAKEQRN